ncbi:MAG: M48 family metallopeptidase [Bacteroidales bacterium]|nr:M48 family metallopeptidase [Bacteroidales bacterium]
MKRLLIPVFAAIVMAVSACGTLNTDALLQGGLQAAQAMSLSDSEVRAYVAEYISQLDAQSKVLPESNAYTKRLRRITSGLTSVDGVPLNFKVYQTSEVNAFACADGSVRVYTGLMDLMTDDEILGVIGHEIGHVAKKHTRKQMQNAILTSAARTGISSVGGQIGALTQSQLGAMGEAILNAKYSRKQETESDDYAYTFLKGAGKNPACLMQSFQKLQSLENNGGQTSDMVSNLFSSHPDTATRITRIQKKLKADGLIK